MTARTVRLSIAPATETTCGDGTGKFCPFVGVKMFGMAWVCTLGHEKELHDANGWLMRTVECLAAEER